MATSKRALDEGLRQKHLEMLIKMYEAEGFEVLRVASGTIAIPEVDSEGNEGWIEIPVKVPKGSRDGDAYDGYSLAEDYKMKQDAKAAKAAERERKAAEAKAKKEKAKAKTTAGES